MFVLRYEDDPDDNLAGEEYVHAGTARKAAKALAKGSGRTVLLCNIVSGHATPRARVMPSGALSVPLGIKSARDDCKAPAACFCSTCREERRALRSG